jgi:hypothetical protein
MSHPQRCLLDKVTARYILESRLKLIERRSLDRNGVNALYLYRRAENGSLHLFIVPQTALFLHRLVNLPRYQRVIEDFSQLTRTTIAGRYFTRWARRLREYGFTREDAAVLSLATFGIDNAGTILSMHYLATYDQPMINNWQSHHAAIRTRFEAMRQGLLEPYRSANLPQLLHVNVDIL